MLSKPLHIFTSVVNFGGHTRMRVGRLYSRVNIACRPVDKNTGETHTVTHTLGGFSEPIFLPNMP